MASDPGPACRLRLVCVPYAGGSASLFRGWERSLPAGVQVLAVQLPGRAERWREPRVTRFDAVVDAITASLGAVAGEPLAFFGHSLGAVVSYEVARRLRDHGREPLQLFVASCSAPLPGRRLPSLSGLDDGALRTELARLGVQDEALAEPELMEVLLPLLRSDFAIADGYRNLGGEALSCPITACRGDGDTLVPPSHAAEWGRCTTGPFRLKTLVGRHLFDVHGWRALLRILSDELSAVIAREGPVP